MAPAAGRGRPQSRHWLLPSALTPSSNPSSLSSASSRQERLVGDRPPPPTGPIPSQAEQQRPLRLTSRSDQQNPLLRLTTPIHLQSSEQTPSEPYKTSTQPVSSLPPSDHRCPHPADLQISLSTSAIFSLFSPTTKSPSQYLQRPHLPLLPPLRSLQLPELLPSVDLYSTSQPRPDQQPPLRSVSASPTPSRPLSSPLGPDQIRPPPPPSPLSLNHSPPTTPSI